MIAFQVYLIRSLVAASSCGFQLPIFGDGDLAPTFRTVRDVTSCERTDHGAKQSS